MGSLKSKFTKKKSENGKLKIPKKTTSCNFRTNNKDPSLTQNIAVESMDRDGESNSINTVKLEDSHLSNLADDQPSTHFSSRGQYGHTDTLLKDKYNPVSQWTNTITATELNPSNIIKQDRENGLRRSSSQNVLDIETDAKKPRRQHATHEEIEITRDTQEWNFTSLNKTFEYLSTKDDLYVNANTIETVTAEMKPIKGEHSISTYPPSRKLDNSKFVVFENLRIKNYQLSSTELQASGKKLLNPNSRPENEFLYKVPASLPEKTEIAVFKREDSIYVQNFNTDKVQNFEDEKCEVETKSPRFGTKMGKHSSTHRVEEGAKTFSRKTENIYNGEEGVPNGNNIQIKNLNTSPHSNHRSVLSKDDGGNSSQRDERNHKGNVNVSVHRQKLTEGTSQLDIHTNEVGNQNYLSGLLNFPGHAIGTEENDKGEDFVVFKEPHKVKEQYKNCEDYTENAKGMLHSHENFVKPQEQPLEIIDVHQYFNDEFNLSNLDPESGVISQIEKIYEWSLILKTQVVNFSGGQDSLEYFILDEKLMQYILHLDKFKCTDNLDALKKKISIIEHIKNLQKLLDYKCAYKM